MGPVRTVRRGAVCGLGKSAKYVRYEQYLSSLDVIFIKARNVGCVLVCGTPSARSSSKYYSSISSTDGVRLVPSQPKKTSMIVLLRVRWHSPLKRQISDYPFGNTSSALRYGTGSRG